jgi:hypothetical protein
MGYTIHLNELEMMHITAALQITIKHLKEIDPSNPNIKIVKDLLKIFEAK